MPNVIKYTTGATEAGCLRKGNMLIGNNTADNGLTFFNGINPPSGGYTIYLNKASGGPSIYCPANDSQLITITNQIAGANYTTAAQCLAYFASQTDKLCVNFNYEGIVTNGLVFNTDAGFTPSYPTTGTTWYDLSGNNYNGTLTNGPTFNSSNSGFIVFDGTNDYISITNPQGINVGVNFSVQTWVKIGRWGGGPNWDRASIITNSYPYANGTGFWISCTSQAGPAQGFAATVGLENFFMSMGGDEYCVAPTPGSLSAYRNSWFNIGVRCNGNTPLKCYINGVEPVSYGCQTNGPSSYTYNSGPFALGSRNNQNEYFSGSISNLMMYNRALSDTEFLQNFNAQKSRFGY